MNNKWMTAERAADLIATHTLEIRAEQFCKDPLVSVCIITFNHEPFIRESLDSVFAQKTSFPFEVLIGEDASSDRTGEIVKEFQAAHPDKTHLLLSTDNLGQNGVLNFVRVFQATRGRYIALLDGDDFWIGETKLQDQVDFLERNEEYAGTYHQTWITDVRAKKAIELFPSHGLDVVGIRDVIKPRSCFHTSSFVFRRCAIPNPLPDWFYNIQSQDLALFALTALHGSIRRIDGLMSVYRRHPGGITATPQLRNVQFHLARIQLWEYFRPYLNPADQIAIDETCEFHRSAKIRKISNLERILWPLLMVYRLFFRLVRPFGRMSLKKATQNYHLKS